MDLMGGFVWLAVTIIDLIVIVLIVNAVISWLVAFDIVGRGNRFIETVWDLTQRLSRPLLEPVRRVVPAVGGVDLSPLILILGLQFVRIVISGLA